MQQVIWCAPPYPTSDCPERTTHVRSVIIENFHRKSREVTELVSMRHRNHLSKPKKMQEFFTNLPSEVIMDILSRFPIRTIIRYKCVCKPWLDLLETDDFAKSHLSKSVPGLVVNGKESCNIFEFDDVLDLKYHDDRYIPVTEFDCSECGMIKGSVNGLLFLCNLNMGFDYLYIINPITQDYIRIRGPPKFAYGYHHQDYTYRFGASRITSQYKVVMIFHDRPSDEESNYKSFPGSACQVYTLGTRVWRSITLGPVLEYDNVRFGSYLNGNIYWLVFDSNGCSWISCFDLEDELFSIFPSPPTLSVHSRSLLRLCALEDCLCLSDNASYDDIVIWFMKDYVNKSWTKDVVISKRQIHHFLGISDDHLAYPFKVFKDGDILMAWGHFCFFYYSTKTKTSHEVDVLGRVADSVLHTSSFLSLKSFVKEKVCSIRY